MAFWVMLMFLGAVMADTRWMFDVTYALCGVGVHEFLRWVMR